MGFSVEEIGISIGGTVPTIEPDVGTAVGAETYMGFSVEETGMLTVGGDVGVFGNPPPARSSVVAGGITFTGGPITTIGLFQGGVGKAVCLRGDVPDGMTTGRSASGSRSSGVSETGAVSGGATKSGGATGGVSETGGLPGEVTVVGGVLGVVSGGRR